MNRCCFAKRTKPSRQPSNIGAELHAGSQAGPQSRSFLSLAVSLLLLGATTALGIAADARAMAQTSPTPRTQGRLAAAGEAQRAGNYRVAEEEYKAILSEQPGFGEVHMNLGLIFQLQNRIPEAVAQFEQALKTNPHLTGANFFLGVDLCKLHDARRALPFLKIAADQEPGRPELLAALATAFDMTGEFENEAATVQRALALQPGDVDLLYTLGHTYEALGSSASADLEKRASNSSRTEQLLGESYAQSSEWPSAVLHFKNALAVSPNLPGIHVELGEVLLRSGNVTRALENFEEELKLDPHSVRAHLRRGEAKLLGGDTGVLLEDWTDAIVTDEPQARRVLGLVAAPDLSSDRLPEPLLQKLGKQAPELRATNTPAAHLALAFIAAQTGEAASVILEQSDIPQAHIVCSAESVQRSLEQDRVSAVKPCMLHLLSQPLPPELRLRIASSLFETGDYDQSLVALAPASRNAPSSPELLYWRARCYERLAAGAYLRLYQADRNSYRVHQLLADLATARRDDNTAISEYRAAIALKPTLPELHYSLGHLLWKNFKVPEARSELETELALNPHHPGSLDDLGQTYLLEQQPEKALFYLKRAATEGLDTPELHRDLGTAYAKLGDYARAGTELNQALPSDHDGSVHFKLAKVYKAAGEKDKAAREFALAGKLNWASHQQAQQQEQRRIDSEK